MKVALIGTTAACVIGFRADLIKAMVAKGNTVYAFALDYDESTRKKVENLGAIPIDYQFSRGGLNPVVDLLNTSRLSKKIKEVAPDLVFSYFSKPVIFGTFASVWAGVRRRVGMLEGLGYMFTDQPGGLSFKTWFVRRIQVMLYGLAFRHLERIIFLNSDDRRDLVEKYRLQVSQVSILGGIGLNLDQFPYSAPITQPVTFLFVGRLLSEKGIHEYIAAARLVKARFPEVRFVVVGGIDNENPGALTNEALNAYVQEGLIEHPGHVSNVVEWIAKSSVFVLPSYREGVPRSTQEAMAVGRPIITSDVPGCRETVREGSNGFLTRPWSPESLAEKMIYFVENPNAIASMGLESHRMARERFDAEEVNARLLSFLR